MGVDYIVIRAGSAGCVLAARSASCLCSDAFAPEASQVHSVAVVHDPFEGLDMSCNWGLHRPVDHRRQ
jgi:hypothetical protein